MRLRKGDAQQQATHDTSEDQERNGGPDGLAQGHQVDDGDEPPGGEEHEIPRDPEQVQRLLRQSPPIRLALPEDHFPFGRCLWQSLDRFYLKIVMWHGGSPLSSWLFGSELWLQTGLARIKRSAPVIGTDLVFFELGDLLRCRKLGNTGEVFAKDRPDLHAVAPDAGKGDRHKARSASVFGVKLDLEETDKLFRLVDPHVADLADDGAVSGDNRQSARIATGRHAKAFAARHRNDLRMAVSVKLRLVAARRPAARTDTVRQRIAHRVEREAATFERPGQLAVDIRSLGCLARRNDVFATAMRQFESLVGRARKHAARIRLAAVLVDQRIAFALVLALDPDNESDEENEKQPERNARQVEVSKDIVFGHLKFSLMGLGQVGKSARPSPVGF